LGLVGLLISGTLKFGLLKLFHMFVELFFVDGFVELSDLSKFFLFFIKEKVLIGNVFLIYFFSKGFFLRLFFENFVGFLVLKDALLFTFLDFLDFEFGLLETFFLEFLLFFYFLFLLGLLLEFLFFLEFFQLFFFALLDVFVLANFLFNEF
jgi:hypothetical protein